MQNTPARCKAISDVFTAKAVCIGSSGGTTVVRMNTQRSSSSYWERLPARSPATSTWPADSSANPSRISSSTSVSRESPVTVSCAGGWGGGWVGRKECEGGNSSRVSRPARRALRSRSPSLLPAPRAPG